MEKLNNLDNYKCNKCGEITYSKIGNLCMSCYIKEMENSYVENDVKKHIEYNKLKESWD